MLHFCVLPGSVVNFYKHYIGDFQRDTGHLSLTQRGAYLCLMHHYYATERPLPNDHAALCRIAGAIDKAERDAVLSVMAFFRVVDSGLMHTRIEAELQKADRQREVNRIVGKLGGRPKRIETESVIESKPNHNPNQTPDTRHQKEIQAPTVLVGKPSAPRPPDCPTEALIALYHDNLPMLPRVEVVSCGRKRALSARWREVVTDPDLRNSTDAKAAAIEWFAWFFSHCAKSKFLTGKAKDWRADFDFLMTPSKFAKVVEGSYHREAA